MNERLGTANNVKPKPKSLAKASMEFLKAVEKYVEASNRIINASNSSLQNIHKIGGLTHSIQTNAATVKI